MKDARNHAIDPIMGNTNPYMNEMRFIDQSNTGSAFRKRAMKESSRPEHRSYAPGPTDY